MSVYSFTYLFIKLVYVSVLPECMSVHCMSVVEYGCQKMMSDALELELETPVSCHVGVKNGTQVLCKTSQCF